jgi:nucleotide-binding universal stress UspA family protein
MTHIASVPSNAGMNLQQASPGCAAQHGLKIKEILVPTDLTKESRTALRYAISLAQEFAAHLTLLHVYQEPYSLEYLRGPQACSAVTRHRRGVETALAGLALEVRSKGVRCSTDLRYGALCEEIADAAKKRDLIVISTHQYGWLGRLAYGCDAEGILHHTLCPILIVRKNGRK